MTGFIEEHLLKFEGLSDDDIAKLNAILPELKKLFQIIQSNWPGIAETVPVLLQLAQKLIAKQKELEL